MTEAAVRPAEHAAESLSKGSRVVVVDRLQQRSWTAEDSARSMVEVVADELGPTLVKEQHAGVPLRRYRADSLAALRAGLSSCVPEGFARVAIRADG